MYDAKLSVRDYTEKKGIVYDGVEVYGGEDDTLIGRYPTTGEISTPLVVSFPWNTNQQGQNIAEAVYHSIEYQTYNPVTVKEAVIDPAVEIGDTILINGKPFLVAKKNDLMDSLFTSDIEAPQEDEFTPEFKLLTSSERLRKSVQTVSKAYATLKVDVDDIVAEVTDGQGNYTVLTMNSQGVVVKGNSGAVTIAGSQIEAGSLVLTNNSSFNGVASTASSAASTASDAASDVYNIANGSYTGGTFINGQGIISPTISSPTITAGTITSSTLYSPTIHSSDFNIYMDQISGGGAFNFFGYFDSTNPLFKITDEGTVPPSVIISSPATESSGSVRYDGTKTYLRGDLALESTYSKEARIILEEGVTYGTLAERNALTNVQTGQIFFVLTS